MNAYDNALSTDMFSSNIALYLAFHVKRIDIMVYGRLNFIMSVGVDRGSMWIMCAYTISWEVYDTQMVFLLVLPNVSVLEYVVWLKTIQNTLLYAGCEVSLETFSRYFQCDSQWERERAGD